MNHFSLLSWQCPHLSVVMSVPVTGTTCVSICPCACTSSIGGLFKVLSTQTDCEEVVCNANHAISHRAQSPHVVLCDPIHLSWPHVMWLSCDLSSRCTASRLLIMTDTPLKTWNLQWRRTSTLRLFSVLWCTSHLLIAPEEWRWINWVLKEPRQGKLTSHSKCTKWRVSDSIWQCCSQLVTNC